jgi:malto-oligosyltrehalose trehalohydrolase
MPFGPVYLPDGRIGFRLWAPSAEKVELVLLTENGRELILPMRREEEGWYRVDTERAQTGSRYQFMINGDLRVADPASRCQPEDVHGPSQLIDPQAWNWRDGAWRGRPWEQAVVYELHVGAFTPEGTFKGVKNKLDYLLDLGVTAIELMPVADFPGRRNWGYDGVLPFAPESAYGTPDDLKDLVQSAHQKGLMVLLDVVYNHFGPEGNYLSAYAADFFTHRHSTPWGDAINYDGELSETVRWFFIHNALYWLEEYYFDGLRLDAVHAICDDSAPDILQAISRAVKQGPARQRHVHLVLENDHNAARYLRMETESPDGKPAYAAQWNDDIHHALRVVLTGETGGYYRDYADRPLAHLGRALTEGFAYQGEPSEYRDGRSRGEPSADLSPASFVAFLQNHDQVGNRAFGERLSMLIDDEPLHAATAILLLMPQIPLLFMGQEWASKQPFLFFCDFEDELAGKVRDGRRNEFARFPEFSDPALRKKIPDPIAVETFKRSVLDWNALDKPAAARWCDRHKTLLALREKYIVPLLERSPKPQAVWQLIGERGLTAAWRFDDTSTLSLFANLSDNPLPLDESLEDPVIYATHDELNATPVQNLPAWSAIWSLWPE